MCAENAGHATVPVGGDHARSQCLNRGKIRASKTRCPAAVARCAQGSRPGRVHGDPSPVGGGAAPGVADCAPASGPGLRAASWGGRGDGALGRDRPDGTQSDTRPRRCPPAGMDASVPCCLTLLKHALSVDVSAPRPSLAIGRPGKTRLSQPRNSHPLITVIAVLGTPIADRMRPVMLL